MSEQFFPEYLNQGSRGPAVVVLQLMLLMGGNNMGITPNGVYDEETAEGVRDLQRDDLGFTEVDVDGNFGPKTRAELKRQYGIDINALQSAAFAGDTHGVGP